MKNKDYNKFHPLRTNQINTKIWIWNKFCRYYLFSYNLFYYFLYYSILTFNIQRIEGKGSESQKSEEECINEYYKEVLQFDNKQKDELKK